MRRLSCLVVALASALSGCVALTSEINDDGVVYHLPKSILTVSVWEYHDLETSNTWYQIGGIDKSAATDTVPTIATYKIEEETIPDPEHRYVIKYRPNAASDDRLCIARTPGGLLYDVQFASDDRTPEIAFNIARFLAGSIETKAGLSRQKTIDGEKLRTRSYSAKVDPFNDKDIDAFNEALKRMFRAPLKISFKRALKMIAHSKDTWPKGCGPNGCSKRELAPRCKSEHICYRTKATLPLELTLGEKGAEKVVDVNYAEVINAWDIGAVSVTRAFLVNKISKFRFEKGALVAAIMRKPSELEELSLMPIHIINAALITPSGLWAAAFTGSTQEKNAMLTDMKILTEKVTNMENSIKSLAQGTGPSYEAGQDLKYSLDCAAPTRGGLINLVAGGNAQF